MTHTIYEGVKGLITSKKIKKPVRERLLLACQKYAYDNQLYEDLKAFGEMKNVPSRNKKPK